MLIQHKYWISYRISIVKDKKTRKSKGVAFVLYLNKEDALKCIEEINNKKVLICL